MYENMVHTFVKKYERYDSYNKTWVDKFDRNITLKITEGILIILHKYKVLEAVCLFTEQKVVKIASKDNYLVVAHIEKDYVSRFRVEFLDGNGTSKSAILKIIGNYLEIKQIKSIVADSIAENRPAIAINKLHSQQANKLSTHIVVKKYERYNGINKTWINIKMKNVSLKITEGILLILQEHRILEAVNLLQKCTFVKIASKGNYVVVAYLEKGFVYRFRVELYGVNDEIYNLLKESNKVTEITAVLSVIGSYLEVKRMTGCPKKEVSVDELIKPFMYMKKYIPLPDYNVDQELVHTLMFDSSFLELIQKEKSKVRNEFLLDMCLKQ